MKKITAFWHRIIGDFGDAAIYGSVVGSLLFYFAFIIMLTDDNSGISRGFIHAVELFLVLHITAILVCAALFIKDKRPAHKVDSEIIGNNFAGFGKKSRMFRHALKNFTLYHFRDALEEFTDIDNGNFALDSEEQGIISFYRGRCYHILSAFPNAVICYEKAEECGFYIPVLPFFIARCCTEIGSTKKALNIYDELLDSENRYSNIVRTEIGNVYIKMNDGKNALRWFDEAIDRHENYSDALRGAAIAHIMLRQFKEGKEFYTLAILNSTGDSADFKQYYKEVKSAILGTDTENNDELEKEGGEDV